MSKPRPDFHTVFVDREFEKSPVLSRVLEHYPDIKVLVVDSREEVLAAFDDYDEAEKIKEGKRVLWLNRYRGELVKYCPAKSPEEYCCCNLHTVNLMSNCIFNCAYCILQGCLTWQVMQVHCNESEIHNALEQWDVQQKRPMRICTGEIADSLALEHIFHHAEPLVKLFAGFKNLFLELKTKSDNVDALLGLNHNKRTVVSFSINPANLIMNVEQGTARLEQRFKAAEKLIEQGYWVAFNIDPVLYTPGWENYYKELVEQLFARFHPNSIAWIHVGILRFVGRIQGIGRQRFPELDLFDQEFVLGPDGKFRYPRSLREKMYGMILSWIRECDPEAVTFSCTEQASHWERNYGCEVNDPWFVNEHVMQKLLKS
jgi:spore photoproduct lyase